MKTINIFAILISLFIIGCAGCGDSDDNGGGSSITINVSGDDAQAPYDGGTITLTVESTGTYYIESKSSFATVGGYKGIDESALPTTLQVDYVRVFQKK